MENTIFADEVRVLPQPEEPFQVPQVALTASMPLGELLGTGLGRTGRVRATVIQWLPSVSGLATSQGHLGWPWAEKEARLSEFKFSFPVLFLQLRGLPACLASWLQIPDHPDTQQPEFPPSLVLHHVAPVTLTGSRDGVQCLSSALGLQVTTAGLLQEGPALSASSLIYPTKYDR